MGRAAVFDVDGTLVDTNHLHVVTWWEAFRQAGHRVPTHAVHRAIGLGSTDLVAHLLGDDRDPDQDAELSAAHKALYGQYFDRLPAFQDAGRLLRRLDRDGWTARPRPRQTSPDRDSPVRSGLPSVRTPPPPCRHRAAPARRARLRARLTSSTLQSVAFRT
ncbi:hypothetical protein SALBM311S_00020 [Streptomyces alboniger]